MVRNIKQGDSRSKNKEFKHKFNFLELYRALVFIPKAITELKRNKKINLIDKNFIERLQLAVTEVNGCPACSYQHAKIALRQGMSNEEISSFLSGGDQYIKTEEAKAIMFAQHFAESRGLPKKYAYEAVIKEYGQKQANIILSALQVMIAGNIYGIPYSAFQSRIKGQSYKNSSVFYELGMLIGGIIILPIALIHGWMRAILGFSNSKFDFNSTDE